MIILNSMAITINLIISAFLFVIFIGLFFFSRHAADGLRQEVNEYGFKLALLAPMGLYLLDKFNLDLGKDYHRKLKIKIIELYGLRKIPEFMAIHSAQKISLLVATAFFCAIIYLTGNVDYTFFVFDGIIAILIWFWADQELDRKVMAKKREILIDLPEFINTIALLVNAGLPFVTAVQKTVKDQNKKGVLYRELDLVLGEIGSGKAISQAYEDLALRCRVPEITRFVSTILQNLNRGSSDMVYVLRILAQEAWGKRKDVAKKLGEEAASKLVFPMVMVFVAIAIIVVAPAVMTMNR